MSADVVIANGLGYDDFLSKLLSTTSNGGRRVVSASKAEGITAEGSNPHLWYDTARVPAVASAIEAALVAVDPMHKNDYATNLSTFDRSLEPLMAAIAEIKAKYLHAPVAYTERVPGYLIAAAGLDVKTPRGFAQSIEDGNEPSAADTQRMDSLMTDKAVRVLLYNAQATSPVTAHVRSLARSAGIPIVGVTETLPKNERSFQKWQLDQIEALLRALGGG